jgi:hypothetical protein
MDDTLRVAHCPGYAPRYLMRQVRQAERLGADSWATSEAYRVAPRLDTRPGYAAVLGTSTTDTRMVSSPQGDAGDNPVMVRRRHPITRQHAEQVTPPGEPRKYAPERWVYSVTYRLHGDGHKVTHVSVHPSPLFCGRLSWLKVMRAALAEVRRAKRLRHYVILTGDLQTSGRLARGLLRLAGLVVHAHGIDYLCHNKALTMVGDLQVLQVDGFDHPWLVADLEPTADR